MGRFCVLFFAALTWNLVVFVYFCNVAENSVMGMKDLVSRDTRGEILRFVIVGAAATLIHYLVYWLLLGHVAAGTAYTAGYLLSLVFNYLLSSLFTFRSRVSLRNGLGFCAAHAVNYLLHISLLTLYLWLGVPEMIAPLPVYAVAIPVNFMLVRFVFK